MPQPYLQPIIEIDINRGVQGHFRDDNWNVSWSAGVGVTATTDGDILTLSGTTNTNGFSKGATPASITFVIIRAKAGTAASGTTLDMLLTGSIQNQQSTFTLTSNYQVFNIAVSAIGTVSNYKFLNQSATGTLLIDYVSTTAYVNTPSTVLTSQDEAIGPDVGTYTTAVNEASFRLRNNGALYTSGAKLISFMDDVYIYEGYLQDNLSTRKLSKVFGGSVMELDPSLDTGGDLLQVNCSGWGQALLNTLVAKDYGTSSDNSGITTFQGVVSDIITSFVNPNGYNLTTTYIQNITGPPAINYMLFKNDLAFDAIKQSIDLATAGDPANATVYPVEFWVDNSENCHMAPLGAWGSDPNPSSYANTLSVGTEHITNNFRKDIINLKNKVHFITALINPPNRDAWTDGNASSWAGSVSGTGGSVTGPSDDATTFKVGTKSVTISWTGRTSGGGDPRLSYNGSFNLGLDFNQFGGKITPPRVRVYVKSNVTPYVCYLWYVQSASQFPANAFLQQFPPGVDSAGKVNNFNDTSWHLIENFAGPFGDQNSTVGSPSWTTINSIMLEFAFNPSNVAAGQVWVDGLYVEGQNHWVATDSTRQTQYGTRETSLTSLKHRASVTQQALAKAELFRLHNPVLRGRIKVPGIPDVLPGQKVTINAASANLSNATLRILSSKHHYGQDEFTTTLELTDDLTNYQSLQLTSMADLLLQIHTPQSKAQRQKDIEQGAPATLSGQPDFTTAAQTKDYPS